LVGLITKLLFFSVRLQFFKLQWNSYCVLV